MKVSEAAAALSAAWSGGDAEITGASVDTRSLAPGNLFFALVGEHQDGHAYVEAAAARGCAACVVDRHVEVDCPVLVVNDVQAALLQYARAHLATVQPKTVAVTGSMGKTTVRALLESILHRQGETVASIGSYNNHIGVPLTAARVSAQSTYYVQEIGANHVGEVSALSTLVQPHVAVITSIAPVHLEGFGGIDGIIQGKSEIVQGLQTGGVLVLNRDHDYFDALVEACGAERLLTVSAQQTADYYATDIQLDAEVRPHFQLHAPGGASVAIELPLVGKHNVTNALCAAAAAAALGVSLDMIAEGLAAAEPEKKRMICEKTAGGVTILNDTYNANPMAVQAAIDTLLALKGRHVLVLGDMMELGDEAAALHAQVGDYAKARGVDTFYGYGALTAKACAAFGAHAQHFTDKAALADALQSSLQPGDVVLVKGSNSLSMWTLVDAMMSDQSTSEA